MPLIFISILRAIVEDTKAGIDHPLNLGFHHAALPKPLYILPAEAQPGSVFSLPAHLVRHLARERQEKQRARTGNTQTHNILSLS
jgi:hypothetical protein